jgi:hypothetical protein
MNDMPNIDTDTSGAERTALALCRAIVLVDGPAFSDLWQNLTAKEQAQTVIALVNFTNSHAITILASIHGMAPQNFPRTMLAEHLAQKIQAMATAGQNPTITQEEN